MNWDFRSTLSVMYFSKLLRVEFLTVNVGLMPVLAQTVAVYAPTYNKV